MTQAFQITRLNPTDLRLTAEALALVLMDCVAGGASVSFMADLTYEEAVGFWNHVADLAQDDGRMVITASDALGVIGVVQVIPAGVPNQPHRGEVAKMLVHRRARGQGIGQALLAAAEDAGRALGLTLLTLDTAQGGVGERLYSGGGWVRVGVIPDYA